MTPLDLRRFAVAQTLFPETTLRRALHELVYVQADPIRAPARAQDLILQQRVAGYRAGDLERRYHQLGVEEDFFLNYGFVTRALHQLMHPRTAGRLLRADLPRAKLLLELVRERGTVHPREVDEHFAHGTRTNYWGGSSNVTTHLLDALHYRGQLRVARREKGIRLYTTREATPGALGAKERRAGVDRLVDVVVRLHAPLPARTLSTYVRRLRYAAPQWKAEIAPALERAKKRLARQTVDGIDWFWRAGDEARETAEITEPRVRLLAPFDPIVHDRTRFEALWGWEYRFEAYTPAAKRKLGYYALPLLWRDSVIGWANVARTDGELHAEIGYVAGKAPRDRLFARELEAELERMRAFLGASGRAAPR